jgi:peptidoglycan/xylan/chitin deacetylase (PgdA/CDA1 family)
MAARSSRPVLRNGIAAQPRAELVRRPAENVRSQPSRLEVADPGASVSVIIAAHNGAATLPAALRSLQRQTARCWEAIVIDDGSTDATAQIARAWADREPRMRTVRQPHAGVAAARNRGVELACGGWLLFLDCDDWLAPDALASLLRLSRERPSAGVALGRAVIELPDGRRLPHDRFDLSDAFGFLCCEGRIAIHSAIVRRALVEEVGGFDPTLRSSEDWDLWQRLARAGAEFAQTDRLVAYYRNRPGSLSKDVLQAAKDGLVVLRRGHAADPRVRRPAAAHALGAPKSALPDRELHWVLWCAARQIALGGEGEPFSTLLPEQARHYDPWSLGELLASGMADVLAVPPAALSRRWPEFAPKLGRLLRACGNEQEAAQTVAIIKARLNGGRRDDPDSLQLERKPRARGAVGSRILQLRWGDKTLGAVAAPALEEMSATTFAEAVARGAALLPLRPALRALPPACAPALLSSATRHLCRALWLAWPRGLSGAARTDWLRGVLRRALAEGVGSIVRRRLSGDGGRCAHAAAQGARLDHWRRSASELIAGGGRPATAAAAEPRRSRGQPQPRAGSATALPILMYHRVAPSGAAGLERYRVRPEAFEAQLDLLRRAGFQSLTVPQLAASLRFERALPARSVLLTFDDGYADFAARAWPLLQRYGFDATVFAVARNVGGAADWDAAYGEAAPLMDWRTLRELAAAGLDVQSHGLTHTRLTELDAQRLFDEALASRALIEAAVGEAPIAFCYPYGARDLASEQVLQACGFSLGVTIAPGFARVGDAEMRIPRVEVAGEDDLACFARKLNLG